MKQNNILYITKEMKQMAKIIASQILERKNENIELWAEK
jgi:hypothetical protein